MQRSLAEDPPADRDRLTRCAKATSRHFSPQRRNAAQAGSALAGQEAAPKCRLSLNSQVKQHAQRDQADHKARGRRRRDEKQTHIYAPPAASPPTGSHPGLLGGIFDHPLAPPAGVIRRQHHQPVARVSCGDGFQRVRTGRYPGLRDDIFSRQIASLAALVEDRLTDRENIGQAVRQVVQAVALRLYDLGRRRVIGRGWSEGWMR